MPRTSPSNLALGSNPHPDAIQIQHPTQKNRKLTLRKRILTLN